MDATNSFDPLKPLKNQKALVAGASSGIGEACALALGAAGAAVAAVVVNFRSDAEEANRVVEAIRRRGSDAIALQADVSREDQVQAMLQTDPLCRTNCRKLSTRRGSASLRLANRLGHKRGRLCYFTAPGTSTAPV
jgi:hypothetical protein